MKKKSLTPLGEAEMEILHLVWALKDATVADVRRILLREREVAYTTVMTIMKNLADKGYLRIEKSGHAYVYKAAQSPDEVRGGVLKNILSKVFLGSKAELIESLVDDKALNKEELAQIEALILKMKAE